MAEKATTKDIKEETVLRKQVGKAVFDDFFGKRLPHEGFTIEESAHKYFIMTNQMNGLPPDHGVFFGQESWQRKAEEADATAGITHSMRPKPERQMSK